MDWSLIRELRLGHHGFAINQEGLDIRAGPFAAHVHDLLIVASEAIQLTALRVVGLLELPHLILIGEELSLRSPIDGDLLVLSSVAVVADVVPQCGLKHVHLLVCVVVVASGEVGTLRLESVD